MKVIYRFRVLNHDYDIIYPYRVEIRTDRPIPIEDLNAASTDICESVVRRSQFDITKLLAERFRATVTTHGLNGNIEMECTEVGA